MEQDCLLCDPMRSAMFFGRHTVWEDTLWRLSVVVHGAVPGFAHLEPKRHIPYLADLDGPESDSLGRVLARSAAAVRDAAGAMKTYVYVFGDRVPHLHFNIAPHSDGDPLRGGRDLIDPDAPDADAEIHQKVLAAVRNLLADPTPDEPIR